MARVPLVPINTIDFKRCGARCKRSGNPCQQPAMKNGRCRLHGGKSTGPKTDAGKARAAVANYKHGEHSQHTKALERLLKQVINP